MARRSLEQVAAAGCSARGLTDATHERFEPSALDRRIVELMVAHGVPQVEIATVIVNPATGRPICGRTLGKYFRKEINEGRRKADAEVAASLYRQAVGRAKVIVDGEVVEEERLPVTSAAIWWTKARMGWKAGGEADEAESEERRESAEPVGRVVVYLPQNGRDDGACGADADAEDAEGRARPNGRAPSRRSGRASSGRGTRRDRASAGAPA